MILPNFMCVGATKSGTTSLYDILNQHSDIYLSDFKEPQYFSNDDFFKKGLTWYQKEFYSNYKGEKAIGEFTPTYLHFDYVPNRIYEALSADVKIIVMLRNPVDRAYSHYLHSVRDNFETEAFDYALSLEDRRLTKYTPKEFHYEHTKFSYISQGIYAEKIKNYLKYFPMDNMFIVIFEEDFVKNRKFTVSSILEFLGVDQCHLSVDLQSNPASIPRSKLIKRFAKEKNIVKSIIKYVIPSVKFRMKLRNYIHKINNKPFIPAPLEPNLRKIIMNKYFLSDIKTLETIINKDLSVWYRH